MISLLHIAGILVLMLGVIHSALGEVLIFKRLRSTDLTLASGSPALSPRHLRALWSTWHLASIFGFGLGLTLLIFTLYPSDAIKLATKGISITFLVSSLFWGLGTRGKHPAWIVFLIISALSWFS